MALSLEEALKFAPKSGSLGAPSASKFSKSVTKKSDGGGVGGIFATGTTGLFKALEIADAPRRAIASTIQEGIDAAQGEGFSFSDWREQYNDKEFGIGKVLANEDLLQGDEWWEKWGARAAGFTGDVLLDPLTYLTAGSGKVVQIGRKGLAHRAWRHADNLTDDVLAELGTSRKALTKIGSDIEQLGLSNVDAADVQTLGRVMERVGDVDGAGQIAGGLHFTIPGTGRIAQRVSRGAIQPKSIQLSRRSAARKGKKAGNAVSRFVQSGRRAGRVVSRQSKMLEGFGGADSILKRQLAEETNPERVRDLRRLVDSQGTKRLKIEGLREEWIADFQHAAREAGGELNETVIQATRDAAIAKARTATKVVETVSDVKNVDKLAQINVNDTYDFIKSIPADVKSNLHQKIADGARVNVTDFKGMDLKAGSDFFGITLRQPGGGVPTLRKQMEGILKDLPQSMENLLSTDLRVALGANFDVLAHRAGHAWQINKLAGMGITEAIEKIDSRIARAISGQEFPVGVLDEDTAQKLLAKFGDDLTYLSPEQAFEVRDQILAHADDYIRQVDEAKEASYNWARTQVDEMAFDPNSMDQNVDDIIARMQTNIDRIEEMTVNSGRRIEDLTAGRAAFTDPKGLELDYRLQAQELVEDAVRQGELADEASQLLGEVQAGRIQGDEANLTERIQWHRDAANVADMEAAALRTQADEIMRSAGREATVKKFTPLLDEARSVEEAAVERVFASAGKVTADEVSTFLQDPDVLEGINKIVIPDSMRMIDWDRMAPEDYIEGIQQVSKLSSPEAMRGVLETYDNALNAFKAAALLSPGFHFRNFFGGVFNNWLGGVDQASYGKVAAMLGEEGKQAGLKGFATRRRLTRARGALARVTEEDQEIYDLLKEYTGILSTGGLYANETDVVGALMTGDISRNPFSSRGRLALANRRLGGNVEDMLRMTLAFDTIKKGGTVDDAISQVFKYHFDYSDLSTFEQSAVRRIVPFYTWTRKNLPLQIENFVTQPGKYTRYLAAKRNIEMFTEEEEIVPSYYKELLAIQLPVEINGATQYLTPDLPFRAAANMTQPGEILGSVSPFLRVPAERIAGKEFFSGIPLRGRYVSTPLPMNLTPGLNQGLAALGVTTQAEDGTWMIRDKNLKAIEGVLPLMGRVRRVDPTADGNEDRWWGSTMSTLFGIGLRSNDERAQAGELYARQLEEAQKAADREALGR